MTVRPALSVSLYVQDRRVLLVGVGHGAEDRAQRLQAAGARIERATDESWSSLELGDFFVVLAHSDSDSLNREIAESARASGAWAYAHDQPDVSDFAFPALAQRGPLAIAVSTQGQAPALAARLRVQLQALLDESAQELDEAVDELARLRTALPRGSERMNRLKELAAKVRLVGKVEFDP